MSRVSETKRARDYLESGAFESLVDTMLSVNPWFFDRLSLNFAPIATELLVRGGVDNGTLYLVGSAALGFSMAPTRPGRLFRTSKEPDASDLDIALVHDAMFSQAWESMTEAERTRTLRTTIRDKKNIYWGRVDVPRLPKRTAVRRKLLEITALLQRTREFRGYKVSVRLYRRTLDLKHYTVDGFRCSAKELKL